jgi:ubiquinone/menaquinone biosynthesis C-methylase UbiE
MTDSPKAFAADARAARTLSALKAAWWGAQWWAVQRVTGRDRAAAPRPAPGSPPPPTALVRARWQEAFAKDAADVAAGLYPLTEALPGGPVQPILRAADLIGEARTVEARRKRRGGAEVRGEGDYSAYPAYYRQNFHYQTGGWFTPESARRYEAQVEMLFSGATGAMRRRALSLLARAWRDRDQRGLRLVDVACGSGAFLTDLKGAFPRASVAGLDLSAAYLAEARARSGAAVVQAAAERLPFADESLDGLTCVYLFHELPPKVRPLAAAEMARVLKPGGVLAFADSVQKADEPELARLLEVFPAFFHEPYYDSYQGEDLEALFGAAGLTVAGRDKAFLTKALLFEKTTGQANRSS